MNAIGGSIGREMWNPNEHYIENMTEEEYKKNKGNTINHFYEKLLKLKDMMNTDTARKIAEHRHFYMENFLEEFFEELNGEK